MRTKFFLSVLLVFIINQSFSQCLEKNIFFIDSVGGETFKIPVPLIVTIREDSVIMKYPTRSNKTYTGFGLVKKDSCQWNADFTEGYSIYRLSLEEGFRLEYPTLKIIYEKSKKWLELLYTDDEKRILTIVRDQ